ncbi:MAG TPA: Crp/Fnr family transcriptional regulator [Tissierellaceae bacterium]|nr:Crp/Fnr family transcriptional regulator [Tissierellaceae bacterium]
MDNYLTNLSKCILFQTMKPSAIKSILSSINVNIANYKKDEVIAVEGSNCNSLGIVLNGQIEIHKPLSSGKVVTINHFKTGGIFGEALIFSDDHLYPATVVSSEDSQIMYIYKEDIVKIMQLESKIAYNFISVLSDRILMLNNRITNLSYDTLRRKISSFLLLEHNKQKTTYLIVPHDRKKMAELLNISRPSLSRELSNMQSENLIKFHKNEIEILNLNKLEQILIE